MTPLLTFVLIYLLVSISIGLYAAMSHGTISMMRNLAKPHSPAMPFGKRPTVMPDTLKVSGSTQDSIPNEGLDIDTIPPKP